MRIVRSVHQCWEDGKLPLLLSRLGIQDGAELSTATKKLGMTLKQYLTTRLSDEVQVIQHSPRTQLVGALPISVDVDSEGGAEALLERTQRTEVDKMPRFCPAFWAAFRVPLEESKRRYVTDHEPIEFRDLSIDEKPFGREIVREYILGRDVDSSEVRNKIHQWLEENQVDSESYRRTRSQTSQASGPQDLLDRVLESLELSELKRVVMPLDVVLKLRRQSP